MKTELLQPYVWLAIWLVGAVWTSYKPTEEPTVSTAFYGHSVVLNGKSLDYNHFSVASRGLLTIVSGNPDQPSEVKLPFRIYLRRAKSIIQAGASDSSRNVLGIQVSEVLELARPGDDLVLELTRANGLRAKRAIQLKWLWPAPIWFEALRSKEVSRRQGC